MFPRLHFIDGMFNKSYFFDGEGLGTPNVESLEGGKRQVSSPEASLIQLQFNCPKGHIGVQSIQSNILGSDPAFVSCLTLTNLLDRA